MSSINFNASATSALETLRNINKDLQKTQNNISTGERVNSAADGVSYWSISTTMRSDNKALGAAQDALGVGAAKVDTAYAATESAIDVLNEIKAKLVTASESSADGEQIQLEVGKLQEQLVAVAKAASFNGENWMVTEGNATNVSVVDGFVRDADGGVKITTATMPVADVAMFADLEATGTAMGGLLGSVMSIDVGSDPATGTKQAQIDGFLTVVDTALDSMTTAGATLGALTTRIDLQDKFASKLSDAIESGVSRLVDADMEEESAKLSALQTQQQLAVQSLSIANSSGQNILRLFQ